MTTTPRASTTKASKPKLTRKPPTSQKGWQIVRCGKPRDALVFRTDLPVPKTIERGQLLVQVFTVALNPLCYKSMSSERPKRPLIAEYNFAGMVVHSCSKEFKSLDRVVAVIPPHVSKQTGRGALMDYAIVSEEHIIKLPRFMGYVAAAGMTSAGLAAYQALVEIGHIEKDQEVFINGGSSAIGGWAIQIARAVGCKVSTSCSPNNNDYVHDIGAHKAYDYTRFPLQDQLAKAPPSPLFSVIFDAIGDSSALFMRSTAYLQHSGIFVSVGPQYRNVESYWDLIQYNRPVLLGGTPRQFKTIKMPVEVSKKNLRALSNLLSKYEKTLDRRIYFEPLAATVYAFEDALSAYDTLMYDRNKGTVVVRLLENYPLKKNPRMYGRSPFPPDPIDIPLPVSDPELDSDPASDSDSNSDSDSDSGDSDSTERPPSRTGRTSESTACSSSTTSSASGATID